MKTMIPELETEREKTRHRKYEVKAKGVIMDSVKDHLVPIILGMKSPRKMYDTLTMMFDERRAYQKGDLRHLIDLRKVHIKKTTKEKFDRGPVPFVDKERKRKRDRNEHSEKALVRKQKKHKSKIKYFAFNEFGHYAYECHEKRKDIHH